MKPLLRDTRVHRLLAANTLGAIGTGVTIFSVPWLLVHEPGGSEAYRWATIGTTIVLLLAMPYWGAWVDRHSRKTGVLASETWGFFSAIAMAVAVLVGGAGQAELVLIYFAGMLYYTLHFPPRFAMIQQMFDRSQYQSLIGLMEIQGQTAMMIAGGLGGWLVTHVPLWGILFFNAFTYLASFLIQATLPYEPTHLTRTAREVTTPLGAEMDEAPDVAGSVPKAPSARSVWHAVGEGWVWLRARPQLTVFFTCSLMPFIIVMAANYLFPIYVAHTLHASAVWFAAGEIAFAIGAIGAGALLPRLLAQHTAATTIPGTMLAFLAGLLAVIVFQLPFAYLGASVLLGFGNAGSRVARSSLMLHVIPNDVMGRVGVFFSVLDRILRTVLVLAMGIIDLYGPPAGFAVLAVVLLAALYGVMQSRHALPRRAAEPSPLAA